MAVEYRVMSRVTVKEIAGELISRLTSPGAEYDRQSPGRLRKGNVLGQKMAA